MIGQWRMKGETGGSRERAAGRGERGREGERVKTEDEEALSQNYMLRRNSKQQGTCSWEIS